MAFPTLVASKILEESSGATSHHIPGYSAAQVGDAVYGLFVLKSTPSGLSITSNPGSGPHMNQFNWSHSTGVNDNLTIVRTYDYLTTGDPFSADLVLATPASQLVAGISCLVRGARDQTGALYNADGAELLPQWTDNPGLCVAPGYCDTSATSRIPNRATDGAPDGPAKLVAVFARVGITTFNTGLNDAIGSGISDGAPYWANREIDLGPGDGTCTTAMSVIDHAESSDGTWKLQAAMAHADIPTADWAGHPDYNITYVYQGQVGLSWWPCNAVGPNAVAVPTGTMGFRFRV